jgi:gas vesicle protein
VNISLEKICCRKETWGYAKEKVKKEREKKLKKMDTKMSEVLKTMGTKMSAMKKREITPALANISTFNKRDMFQGA